MQRVKFARAVVPFAAAALVLAAASCSSDDQGGSNGTGGAGGQEGALGFGGAVSSGSGTPCEATADCSSGVCHPITKSCVSSHGTCLAHADCPATTFCDPASGTCLGGSMGSPCASDDNCMAGTCLHGVCGCDGLAQAQESVRGPVDIYFVFDRTSSMGRDCDYQPGSNPPTNSKACFATYALSDYLTAVTPGADTRLAFQFMSLANDDCDGTLYATPLVDLTQLPVATDHVIVQSISNEGFEGGFGTHIEGALRGIIDYTSSHRTPGREMIGVLMTDGDPNGCEEDIQTLRSLIADHHATTGIRTFIIGMEGATDENLEELGTAGGAEPHSDWCGEVAVPCHYWNVEDGSGAAIANALNAIIDQAAPLPCEYDVSNLDAPEGQALAFDKINVTLTDPNDVATTIGQVPSEAACPSDRPAWYYDDPSTPTSINLCDVACRLVSTAETGSRVAVVVGCESTVILR
jgi:hypothetical protein